MDDPRHDPREEQETKPVETTERVTLSIESDEMKALLQAAYYRGKWHATMDLLYVIAIMIIGVTMLRRME